MSTRWRKLVCDFDQHFHARVNRADHRNVAGVGKCDRRRVAGWDRTEIELGSGSGGNHIVDDVVIVQKHQRITLLDRNFCLGKYPSFLFDRALAASATAVPDKNAIANMTLNVFIFVSWVGSRHCLIEAVSAQL